jgi:DNA polymerase-1
MKPSKNQTSFLDGLHREDMQLAVSDWQLPELPDLDRYDWFVMDLETTGLRWWDTDRMIGAAVWTPDDQVRYLPIRHQGGPNIPEEQFFRWVKSIRNKRMVNIRTKFDLHMLRKEDVDLEAQGCTFGDVAHYAALLDDHRRRFNQADLARDYLEGKILPPGAGKVTSARGFELDPTKFAEYPSGLVAERACSDVRTVALLHHVMYPMLTEQDLHRVREIEDAIIPVVVEMEHNGAPIDVETLNRWCGEATQDLERAMWEIQRLSGCRMETPDKREDEAKLFQALRIDIPRDPETGEISYADDLLVPIKHPAIQKLREAKQLRSLLSKFLLKYQRSVARDGILRYELHQLPYQDDDKGGGAVSGRFSSAAPSRDEGANIQQVFGVKAQEEPYVDDPDNPGKKIATGFTRKYIIKKLFKPDRSEHKDAVWFKADASQFQFRLFAHYSEDPKLLAAYADDMGRMARGEKLVDFHDAVHDLILDFSGVDLSRTHTKNVNFAQVFAAKERKMAEQLGVPADQIPNRGEPLESGGPEFLKVLKLSRTYHEMFPRVAPLLKLTEHLAMPGHQTGKFACGRRCRDLHRQGYTHRGYVKTYLGRRARFGPHDRHYSSLNRIIQGTEGDVNKRILVETHKMRKELGLRPHFTVHDEYDSTLYDAGNFDKVRAVLNTQYYDFKVPILWEAGKGPSWGEAK